MVAALLLSALLPCCTRDAGHQGAGPVRRDSAGIAIVENDGATAWAASRWRVDTIPDLDIGGSESDSTRQWFRLGGMAMLPDGRLVVVDQGTQQIRFFDKAGALLSQTGRQGSGPGEYRFPSLVPSAALDSLLISDFGGGFTVLDSHGNYARSVRFNGRFGSAAGQVSWLRLLATSNTAALAFNPAEGVMANDMVVLLRDLAAGTTDTVGRFPSQQLFAGNHNGQPSFTEVPFDIPTSLTAGRDCFYLTTGTAEVQRYDAKGALRGITRVQQPGRRVTKQDFDEAVDERVAGEKDAATVAELRRLYAKMPLPDAMPVFQRLLVDADGNVWAEAFRAHTVEPATWAVFDATGAALGALRMPGRFSAQQIGHDFVLGAWRDALGVDHVRRYALRRSAT